MAEKRIASYKGRHVEGPVDLEELLAKLEEIRVAIAALPQQIADAIASEE